MAEHSDPDHTPVTDRASATDGILAMIGAEEPHEATADQVARAIGLTLDGEAVQSQLDELVAQGLLDQRGLGPVLSTRSTRQRDTRERRGQGSKGRSVHGRYKE